MEQLTEQTKELLTKYQDGIKKSLFLPLFIDALVTGGIELFDEVREAVEAAGVDLTKADFTRLR